MNSEEFAQWVPGFVCDVDAIAYNARQTRGESPYGQLSKEQWEALEALENAAYKVLELFDGRVPDDE